MKNAPTSKASESAVEQRDFTAQDLFPDTLPTVLPARWPTEGTRAHDALLALLAGPVNQRDYGPSWRLAASVQALEYDGWCIKSRRIRHPRCAAPIAEYTLDRRHPANVAAIEQHRQRTRQQGDALLETLLVCIVVVAPGLIFWGAK